jgi:hypothetical protein
MKRPVSDICRGHYTEAMAKMSTCPCGFVVISPVGEDDVLSHIRKHLTDNHPGMVSTDDEIRKKILSL